MATTGVTPAPLTRSLSAIAEDILADYRSKGRPVHYAAAPYVQALGGLRNLHGHIGYDSAEEIVIRLLGNLGTWRGETATRVKAELRAALAHHQQAERFDGPHRRAAADITEGLELLAQKRRR